MNARLIASLAPAAAIAGPAVLAKVPGVLPVMPCLRPHRRMNAGLPKA